MMLGVDNLPTSVPREASSHFSQALAPFVPALAEQDPTQPFEEWQAPGMRVNIQSHVVRMFLLECLHHLLLMD
jgi:alanine dehydrogenase